MDVGWYKMSASNTTINWGIQFLFMLSLRKIRNLKMPWNMPPFSFETLITIKSLLIAIIIIWVVYDHLWFLG